jgi:DNA-binding XRE family transcriptional regulator
LASKPLTIKDLRIFTADYEFMRKKSLNNLTTCVYIHNITDMNLRARRKELRLTQVELAARAGVTQAVITDLETGRNRNPSWQIVGKLARALKIDPSELFPVAPRSEVA